MYQCLQFKATQYKFYIIQVITLKKKTPCASFSFLITFNTLEMNYDKNINKSLILS